MLKRTSQVALGGMIAALCVLLMMLTGILPFLTYAVPAMAGFLMVVMVVLLQEQLELYLNNILKIEY